MITSAEALAFIASAPGSAEKTPTDLRETAADIERMAIRKDRVTVARQSNRRKARAKASAREAGKLTAHAQLCRSAAEEIERRKCPNVREAVKHPLVRAARRITGRRG